jgi:hypothetical protein
VKRLNTLSDISAQKGLYFIFIAELGIKNPKGKKLEPID